MQKLSKKPSCVTKHAKLPNKRKHVFQRPSAPLHSQRRSFAINITSQSADDATPKANDFKILPSAVKQLYGLNRLHLEQNGSNDSSRLGIRITVDTGGCSGFQYIFSKEIVTDENVLKYITSKTTPYDPKHPPTADSPAPQDLLVNGEDIYFIQHQQFVVVDDVSFPFIKNSEFEYKVELIRSGFGVVNNPNVDLACGCGTSFSKKSSADV